MRRVAIPIEKGRLSEYFGQCSHYEIFDVEGVEISSNEVGLPPNRELARLPEWAAQQGITDIISYKIDRKIINLFSLHKINLFVGIPLSSPEKLIEDFLKGRLKSDGEIITEIFENNE